MAGLMLLLAALAADPSAGATAAGADGIGCVYEQLGEAGRGIVARGFDDGDGDLDSLHRAMQRLNETMNACTTRLGWDRRPIRATLSYRYALDRSLTEFYERKMRETNVDLAVVGRVYDGLSAEDRLLLYRGAASEMASADDAIAAELTRRKEYAEDATWDTKSTSEVFFPLASAAGLEQTYPAGYVWIPRWFENRFDLENDQRIWAMLGAVP